MSARRLKADAPDFEAAFRALLDRKVELSGDIDAVVAPIMSDVCARGDAALAEHALRLDRVDYAEAPLVITAAEVDDAVAKTRPEDRAAIDLAAARIRAFHERQRPEAVRWTDAEGVEMGWRWTPVDAAGLYVPGGAASYPSSVLMNAVPAEVAGVGRIAMAVPTPDGAIDPLVLYAARTAGVSEIYRMGGAQAIAALAYGTQTVAPVDVVVGPGNAYVTAAKKRVFGHVGIDMIAGPSEILVIADASADPAWIAMDLLSQAEHDPAAQALLITDDAAFAEAVARAVDAHLADLPRAGVAGESWRENGAIILVDDVMRDAARIADRIAAEHLQLAVADADALSEQITHAGAIFLGTLTPEAVGDYVGGPDHVLPTARAARYASGLGVLNFMKRTTLLRAGEAGLAAIGPAAVTLGRAEGLDAHARSVAMRLERAGR
ncbi:MAG: histidinol dehydrogenase [Rhodothalassiaceae bacterium]